MMAVPACQAADCVSVADGPGGLCTGHRRSLTITTKMQDSVREFLQGSRSARSAVSPSRANVDKVEEAGEYLAQGLALLVSTEFDDVTFEPCPLGLARVTSSNPTTPWRVRFAWTATDRVEEINDDDELIESLWL